MQNQNLDQFSNRKSGKVKTQGEAALEMSFPQKNAKTLTNDAKKLFIQAPPRQTMLNSRQGMVSSLGVQSPFDPNRYLEEHPNAYLCEEDDQTYQLLGGDTKLTSGKRIDPGTNLNFVNQVSADSRIKDSVLTPFDKSQFCQIMTNPHTKMSDNSYEIITVQHVRENIRLYDNNERLERNMFLSCKNREHVLSHYSIDTIPKICDYCGAEGQAKNLYSCQICSDFHICQNCQLKSFIRRNVEQKTSRHRFYQDFFLKSVDEPDSTQTIDMANSIRQNDQMLDKFEQNSREVGELTGVTSHHFANVVLHSEKMSWSSTTQSLLPEHAIVGFWSTNDQGNFDCYRQFRVDQPLFFSKAKSGTQIETLFHVGEQGQVYYFKYDQSLEVSYNEVDLESAMVKDGNDQSNQENDFVPSDNLELVNRKCFRLPTIQTVEFKDVTQQFLQEFFRVKNEKTTLSNTPPKLYATQETTLLCFRSPYDICQTSGIGQVRYEIKPKKSQPSLVFIDLSKPEKFAKMIFDAYLLINMYENQNTFPNISGFEQDTLSNLYLWYSSKDSIQHVKWEDLTDPNYTNFTQPNYPLKTLQSFKLTLKKQEFSIEGLDAASQQKKDKQSQNKLIENIKKYWYESTEIQSRMNRDFSRCTILFGSKDYFVFELFSYPREANRKQKVGQPTGEAQVVLEHPPADDCSFAVMEDDPDASYIVCNMQQQDEMSSDNEISKQNVFTLDFFDLDQAQIEEINSQREDNVQSHDKLQMRQLKVILSSGIKKNLSEKGYKFPPYQFTTFNLYQTQEQKENGQGVSFVNQLFFTDQNLQQEKVAFTSGSEQDQTQEEQTLVLQKPQKMFSIQFQIKWPIMMHNTHLPQQNQLIMSNLAQNVPQVRLDLGDYSFLNFVDTGEQVPFSGSELMHSQIFFLVLTPKKDAVRLMYYSTFAWPVAEDNDKIIVKRDALRIVAGTVCKLSDHLFPAIVQKRIMKANILNVKLPDRGEQVSVVIQFNDCITVFNLNRPDKSRHLVDPIQNKMAQLIMISAPNNQLYYVISLCRGDKLIAIGLKGSEVYDNKVLEMTQRILQIQIAHNQKSVDFHHMLYMITDDGRFKKIINRSNQEITAIENQHFEIVSDVLLSGVDSLLNRLQSQGWQRIVMNPKMITCQKEDNQEKVQAWEPQGLVTFNLESLVKHKHDFLDFAADLKQQQYLDKTKPKDKMDWDLLLDCHVKEVQQIGGVNKIMTINQERDFNYVLVKQAFESHQIDLFDQQNSQLVTNMHFVGDKIAVQMPNQTLFFSQYDMMLKKIEPFMIKEKLENNYSAHIESEYFTLQCQVKQKDGKFKTQTPLVKLDGSTFKVVREHANYQNFNANKVKIKKTCQNNGCTFNKLQPTAIMSNMGTFTQVYFTNPQASNNYSGVVSEVLNVKTVKKVVKVDQKIKTYIYMVTQSAVYPQKWYQVGYNNLKMLQFCDKLGNEEKDVFYIVKRDEPINEQCAYSQICLTTDYLVIKVEQIIYYCKLDDIKKVNSSANKQIIRTQAQHLDEESISLDYLHEKMFSELCEVKMSILDTSQLFNERIHENDFQVIPLTHQQIRVVDHYERRDNLIQLMFQEISLVWDLNDNSEVFDCKAPDQFSSPETFSNLGININVKSEKSFAKMKTAKTILENKESSLYIRPSVNQFDNFTIFRQFTTLSLWEIKTHLQELEQGSQLNQVDLDSICVNIYGHTYFEMLRNYPEFHNLIREQLDEKDLESFQDQNRIEHDNIFIRRLKVSLNTPLQESRKILSLKGNKIADIVKEQKTSILLEHFDSKTPFINYPQNETLLQQTLRDTNCNTRLLLESQLSFHLMSSEVHMQDMINDFEDFKFTFQYSSQHITSFMDAVFRQNEFTQEIKSVPWDSRVDQIVFGTSSAHYSTDEIMDCIDKGFDKRTEGKTCSAYARRVKSFLSDEDLNSSIFRGVSVNVVRISWLSNNMDKFYYFMASMKDITVFDTQLVKVVLSSQKYSNQLAWKVFLPWIIYFCVNINYMSTKGIQYEQMDKEKLFQSGWQERIIMTIAIIFYMGMEFSQMCRSGMEYFKDIWNWNYMLIYILNALIMCKHVWRDSIPISKSAITELASMQVMQIWIGLFYWLRLFDAFSKYIHLIVATLKDVVIFMILFFIILFCFANGLYILDYNTADATYDFADHPNSPDLSPCLSTQGKVIENVFDNSVVDAVVNQYLLSLGEFAIDSFEGSSHAKIIWIMFIIATFFSNILFLNMIIAIMGDTFGRVQGDWERSGLIERTRIYADYMPQIQLSNKFHGQKFLYVVTPKNESEDNEFQSALSQVQDQMKKNQARINQDYKNHFDMVCSNQSELQLSMNKQQRDVMEVKASFSSEIREIKSTLDQLLELQKKYDLDN